MMVDNTASMASFFVTYLMQATMFSNTIQILDIFHFGYKAFFRWIWWMRELPFKDEWGFQLGYFQSFVYTISFMSLVFSISLPIISIFAVLFFFLRYYIEKYNFLFVYEKEFESKGLLKMITDM
jgi:hypothetical protein